MNQTVFAENMKKLRQAVLAAIPPPATLCKRFVLGYSSFASVYDVVNSINPFGAFVKRLREKRKSFLINLVLRRFISFG